MTNLMQTVMDRGTGGSARWKYNFTRPAAGKTGTTQGWSDAWFAGFTPQIAACVWFGVDDYKVSLGRGQDGSKAALPSWAKFMRESHNILEMPRVNFQKPEGVIVSEICSVSKKASRKACPLEKEVYKVGTAPSQKCRIHRN
jgi:penicillin-binding protein 1A